MEEIFIFIVALIIIGVPIGILMIISMKVTFFINRHKPPKDEEKGAGRVYIVHAIVSAIFIALMFFIVEKVLL